MRITLPAPGVSRMQKNGRSQPSAVYNSITCLLLFGPWRSSILTFSGRPSVFIRTSTLSTVGSKGYVRRAPPCTVVAIVSDDVRGDGELDLADVADGDRVRAAGCLDHGAEGPELAVLAVHAHLHRRVVGSVPELDVRIKRATLGAEHHLHLLHSGRAVRPGAEGSALHEDGGVNVDSPLRRDIATGLSGTDRRVDLFAELHHRLRRTHPPVHLHALLAHRHSRHRQRTHRERRR